MKIKIYAIAILILVISCVGNDGEYYSVLHETKTYTFDFTTPGDYTYNAGELQVVDDKFSLISSATLFDNFDDNTSTNYSSALTSGTASNFTEANEVMTGDCDGGGAALIPITNLATNDYVLYHESTPTSFDGTAELSTLVRYNDTNNHYRVSSVNGSHTIYINNAATETVLATVVDADFTLATGTTYATRVNVDGDTIEYKIWVPATEPEPATYTVSTTDTNHATGGFALYCTESVVQFDNIYELPASGTNNTALNASTLVFPVLLPEGQMIYINSFEMEGTVLDAEELLFDVSFDGGATYKTYANYWRTNVWAENGAMTLSELNANIRSLKPESNSLIIRVYFNSADGWANAELESLTISYEVLK